jgi:TPR repeat protein
MSESQLSAPISEPQLPAPAKRARLRTAFARILRKRARPMLNGLGMVLARVLAVAVGLSVVVGFGVLVYCLLIPAVAYLGQSIGSEFGHASSARELADRYSEGDAVVSKNLNKAVKLMEQAVAQGDREAASRLTRLAWRLTYDEGGRDLKRARRCWRLAAEQGDAEAQEMMGDYYYFDGRGDVQEALAWYRRAADNDRVDAQFHLAWMLSNGVAGVERDYKEALKWYRRAAIQGYASAQNNLGVAPAARSRPRSAG